MLRRSPTNPVEGGLLPSAIEDKEPLDHEMKRGAEEIEETPKAQAQDGLRNTKPELKHLSENRDEIAKIMLAQSKAMKRAALGLPFQAPKEAHKGLLGPVESAKAPIKPPVNDGMCKLPPLSNESIANILKTAKPECPKAKTWVEAQEIIKNAKERMKARMEEREELRKKIHRKLHARLLVENPGASNTNLQAVRGEEDDEYSKLTPMERVQRAHERYQKVLAEFLDSLESLDKRIGT